MASLYIRICHTHTHAKPVGPRLPKSSTCYAELRCRLLRHRNRCGRKLCHGPLWLQAVAHHSGKGGVAAIAGLICECCMSFRHARQLEPRGSVHNRLDVQRPLG
jgi:hypothetical protein